MSALNTKRPRLIYYSAIILTLIIIITGWWLGSAQNLELPGSQMIAIGRLFGLLAAFCILLEVLLIARTPFLEKNFDLDELNNLHRLNGYFVLFAFIAHIVFLTIGYAQPLNLSLWTQFWQFNTGFAQVMAASIGALIFFATIVVSINIARKRLPYELWYFTHLALYIAIILTFGHQILSGGDFINQPWFKLFWNCLYALTFGLLLAYRFIRPLYFLNKYRFKVGQIIKEADGVHSIYITGKNLNNFNFIAGQYATWRFLSSGVWHEAHPYSFSSSPGQKYLRLTVKTDTKYGGKLSHIPIGKYVLVDGPRGAFTALRSKSKNVVLIGGGIGVAPFLSIINKLIADNKNVTLYYAAHDKCQCSFKNEFLQLKSRGLSLNYFISNEGNRIDELDLKGCSLPDTDIFICGPDRMSKEFEQSLIKCGHPKNQIIVERFAM